MACKGSTLGSTLPCRPAGLAAKHGSKALTPASSSQPAGAPADCRVPVPRRPRGHPQQTPRPARRSPQPCRRRPAPRRRRARAARTGRARANTGRAGGRGAGCGIAGRCGRRLRRRGRCACTGRRRSGRGDTVVVDAAVAWVEVGGAAVVVGWTASWVAAVVVGWATAVGRPTVAAATDGAQASRVRGRGRRAHGERRPCSTGATPGDGGGQPDWPIRPRHWPTDMSKLALVARGFGSFAVVRFGYSTTTALGGRCP